jgi:hypothetical protein
MSAHAEREARLQAMEEDHLLEGEDPDSNNPEDAVHWERVYADLLKFKRSLLSRASRLTPRLETPARHEVNRTDVKLLTLEAEKFERRLEFWRRRRRELGNR